eukprot:TRINITY_DN15838_c1_g2_i1.p1 TRINITY_DN15838_c1_g2~~TRINITY_DN15838_c1_g2_i1.p1  ORF type:complete len:561 (-),score=80.13 TRINITY_DN15838_c1_g2_i1:33-1676(-)
MAIAHRDVAGLLKKRGYQEVKKIGEGSFGKAILVQNRDGNRLVCKMVDVSKASAKEQRDALQEGQLLSTLKHPYIVRYRENFTEAGWFCILMDYCESGDLTKQVEHSRRSRTPLPEDQVLRWFTQAILALKYIHDRHILHRDLKPGNFFLSKSGSVKMGDFGIAKVLSCTMACARTQIGTPYYLSPEVCQEKPYAWPSDIWAMGCILYELCAAKVPFDASNISGLVQKIIRGPMPTPPAKYSEFTRGLISEMMNRNPGKRPSTDDILKRPQIQAIVRQMLDEVQPSQESVKVADPTALAPAANVGRDAAKAAAPGTPATGPYKKGDAVEYHSSTHQDWLPASVLQVDGSGRIIIDLKPNTWMSPEEQAIKIRRRRGGAYPNRGAVAAIATPSRHREAAPRGVATPQPMQHRSPSAVALPPAPGAICSPMRQRSPSLGAMAQPPPSAAARGRSPSVNATPRDCSPARGIAAPSAGAPGSRASSPRRSPSRGPSPAPSGGGGAARAGGGDVHHTPRIRPPGIPRAGVADSPLGRRNPSAGAVGAAIAGS